MNFKISNIPGNSVYINNNTRIYRPQSYGTQIDCFLFHLLLLVFLVRSSDQICKNNLI